MRCPLFVTHVLLQPGKMELSSMDCLKGECAWWGGAFARCDPTGLSHTLERLTDEITEMQRILHRAEKP